jgi:hypothetical protein
MNVAYTRPASTSNLPGATEAHVTDPVGVPNMGEKDLHAYAARGHE